MPWEGIFESTGNITKEGLKPQKHYSSAIWDDEVETKTYTYNTDGTFAGLTIEGTNKQPEKKDIDAALADYTSDILTSTLSALQDGDCSHTDEIFDGKRRFKIKYTHIEDTALTQSNYNVFEGEAGVCEVEIEPLAGAWHKKPRGWLSIQEQGRQKGELPRFWYAKLGEKGPVMPVKLVVHTKYGTLTMNLEKISE